jgi:hypothetical protein
LAFRHSISNVFLGWLRGRTFGGLWTKALALAAPALLLFACTVQADTAVVALGSSTCGRRIDVGADRGWNQALEEANFRVLGG